MGPDWELIGKKQGRKQGRLAAARKLNANCKQMILEDLRRNHP